MIKSLTLLLLSLLTVAAQNVCIPRFTDGNWLTSLTPRWEATALTAFVRDMPVNQTSHLEITVDFSEPKILTWSSSLDMGPNDRLEFRSSQVREPLSILFWMATPATRSVTLQPGTHRLSWVVFRGDGPPRGQNIASLFFVQVRPVPPVLTIARGQLHWSDPTYALQRSQDLITWQTIYDPPARAALSMPESVFFRLIRINPCE